MLSIDRYSNLNCYELLGIYPGSSIQEIKTAFRRISMTTHPDKGGSNEAQAKVNYAYAILSDPVRRRQHDEKLYHPKPPPGAHEKQAPGTVKKGAASSRGPTAVFSKAKAGGNFVDRVRKEVQARSEKIRADFKERSGSRFNSLCAEFRTARLYFAASIIGMVISAILGIYYPVIWIGVVISSAASIVYMKYPGSEQGVYVASPDWKHSLKLLADRIARNECDAEINALHDKMECIERLVPIARNPSGFKDSEDAIVRRIAISFFLSGYVPCGTDDNKRIMIVTDGDEQIVVRYRHRGGMPVNIAYVKKMLEYMRAHNASRGFLFATPGLSGNAAACAGQSNISHYSIKEMNAWIKQTIAGNYSGPGGDILEHCDSIIDFLRQITPGVEGEEQYHRRFWYGTRRV